MQEEFCVVNIGPKQRRQRLNFGLVMLVMGSCGTIAVVFSGASRWFRLLLFIPFTLAGYGIFQARQRT